MVMPSGRMPSCSKANSLPVRPRPDWISSSTRRLLLSSASLRRPCRKPLGGITTPPSPWMGSMKMAQVFGVMARRTASRSP